MDAQRPAMAQPGAHTSFRTKIRGKVSKHLAALSGNAQVTMDPTVVTDSTLGSCKTMSDDNEEDQSGADSDEKQQDTKLDMWAEAEKRLREDKKKRHILEEYNKILEAHFGATIEPIGTQARRKQFASFLVSEIEKLQQAQMEDNTKWSKCKRRAKRSFETAAKVVVASKDIIAPATNTCLPAGVACTGVVVILSFCLKAVEQRQVLFESLDHISGSIRRIAEYEALCWNTARERNKETEDAFTDACCNILVFQAHVLCFLQRNRLASAIRNTFEWDGWSNLLLGIANAEKRVKSCAEREQMHKVVDIYEKAHGVGEIANKLLQQQQTQEATAHRSEANAFLRLLLKNTCNYEESKLRNRERVLGTCDWFTDHALFTEWGLGTVPDTPSLLYVTADPGCGKSVLSRYLVDEILPDDSRMVCYFFFKDDFEQQKTATSTLCALLHQIFDKNRHLLTTDVLNQYGARGETLFSSFHDLWKMFTDAASHQETVCVIDALDECREADMKQLVEAVSKAHVPGLRFMLTSRPYSHVRSAFSSNLLSRIHIQGDREDTAAKIVEEIKLVVDNRVDEAADKFLLSPEECQLMRDQLASVSNRTYLWVSLVFDGLMGERSITKADILRLTKQLPHDVYAAYEKILQKSQDQTQARRLLHLILGAKRPLTLSEVSVALVLDISQPWKDVEERTLPETRVRETIRNLCGLFVSIIDDRVYLLHQTTREFLLYDEPQSAPRSEEKDNNNSGGVFLYYLFLLLALLVDIVRPVFHHLWLVTSNSWQASMRLNESNEILAETCIARLLPTLEIDANVSLFDYAAEYWPTHYVQSGPHFRTRMGEATQRLCSKTQINGEWWDIYYSRQPSFHPSLTDGPLIMASFLGIDGAVKAILSQKSGETKKALVNNRDLSYGRTPLCWAAVAGHETVIKLLLATDPDVDSKDNHGRTPLSWAAWKGHEAVVKLLLATDTDVDSKDNNGRTPLLWAAWKGDEAVVQLLLATDTDVDSKDNDGMMPLLLAAWEGHEAVVKLLLATDIDVDSKDNSGRTPLSWAAWKGHEAVVKLLLATDVDIDSKDNSGRTPLSWAAWKGDEAVIKLLLTDFDVDSDDNDSGTPFSLADWEGEEAVVKLLLAADADVDSKDNHGRTPLSQAVVWGNEAVVKLLLATDADVDSKDNNGRTPLSQAVVWGNEAAVKLLLATGQVEIDSKDNDGRTPLSWAAVSGHEAVVELLLATGQVEIDSKDNNGRTPLSWAAERGEEAVVELLKANGGTL